MNYEIRVIDVSELEEIYEFENSILQNSELDTEQKMLFSWKAPWRREALEFYLPNGWCFAIRESDSKQILGYYLAQPILFMRALTQTLWVEHLSFQEEKIAHQLIDLAYRAAREKRLQSVLFQPNEKYSHLVEQHSGKIYNSQILEIKATRHQD